MLGKNNIGGGSNAIELDDATLNIYAPRGSNIEVKTKGKIWRGVAGNIHRIPDEYVEVKYLEATGTQYINTNTTADTVEVGFNVLNGNLNVGSRVGGSNQEYQVSLMPNSIDAAFGNGFTSLLVNSSPYDIIKFNKNGQFYFNNNLMTTRTGNSNNLNIYLFAINTNNNSADGQKLGQIKYAKFWNSNTLIRNMIPCYRISDHKPGMYDTVNNVFYTNAGSGEFILGPEMTGLRVFAIKNGEYYIRGTHWDGIDTKVIGIYENGEYEVKLKLNEHNIPNIYQEIEYLENTSTSYIIAPIIFTKLDYFNIEFQVPTLTVNSGYGNYNDGNRFAFVFNKSNFLDIGLGEFNDFTQFKFPTKVKIESGENSNTVIINSISYGVNNTFSQSDSCNYFGFFAVVNKDGSPRDSYCLGKFFNFQVGPNINNITHHYVCVYRKSDQIPGVYDVINKQFYTNAGTGTFIVGDDV